MDNKLIMASMLNSVLSCKVGSLNSLFLTRVRVVSVVTLINRLETMKLTRILRHVLYFTNEVLSILDMGSIIFSKNLANCWHGEFLERTIGLSGI